MNGNLMKPNYAEFSKATSTECSLDNYGPCEHTQANPGAGVNFGYLNDWGIYRKPEGVQDENASGFMPFDIQITKFTHILYSFVAPDGTCTTDGTGVTCENGDDKNYDCKPYLIDPWADYQKTFNGGCVSQDWSDAEAGKAGLIYGLQQMKAKRNPDAKLLFSFGGWTMSSAFTHCAKNRDAEGKPGRATWVKTAVDLMVQYEFDGIDVDWEYAGGGGEAANDYDLENDGQNYVALLQDIRTECNARGLTGDKCLITLAVGAGPSKVDYLAGKGADCDGNYPPQDGAGNVCPVASDCACSKVNFWNTINDIVDYVNLMAYDFNGQFNPYTAHNAPLKNGFPTGWDAESAVDGITGAGLDAKRLVLGTPLYGRDWKGVNAAEDTRETCDKDTGLYCTADQSGACGSWESGVLDFTNIQQDFLEADGITGKNGFTRHWDENCQVPYLYNDVTGDFISYDDVESTRIKAEYARDKGLAGTMTWDMTNDRADTLIDVLKEVSMTYTCRAARRQLFV